MSLSGLLLPPARAFQEAPAPDLLTTGKSLYGRKYQELIIRDFFQDRRDGVYLDVGCAWAIKNSTTYYLEKHLNWSGIGVDALPDYAEEWARERPRSRFFNYLVTDRAGTVESFFRRAARGLSSTQSDRVFKERQLPGNEIKVPTITLTKLLDDNGVTAIDFLSMDIEGSEPEALAGFDIERFRPKLVCIEATKSVRKQIVQYFRAHGYERVERYRRYDRGNWYFTPKAANP